MIQALLSISPVTSSQRHPCRLQAALAHTVPMLTIRARTAFATASFSASRLWICSRSCLNSCHVEICGRTPREGREMATVLEPQLLAPGGQQVSLSVFSQKPRWAHGCPEATHFPAHFAVASAGVIQTNQAMLMDM